MNMLISELQMLAGDWRSWIVVGLLAVLAVQSVGMYFMCPYINGTAEITDEEVENARTARFRPGPRFAIMMFSGIGLSLAGLFMINAGFTPLIALSALVIGVVVIQTEPMRSRIRENRRQVALHRDAEVEVQGNAQARLRISQGSLALANVFMALALVVALIAFR